MSLVFSKSAPPKTNQVVINGEAKLANFSTITPKIQHNNDWTHGIKSHMDKHNAVFMNPDARGHQFIRPDINNNSETVYYMKNSMLGRLVNVKKCRSCPKY